MSIRFLSLIFGWAVVTWSATPIIALAQPGPQQGGAWHSGGMMGWGGGFGGPIIWVLVAVGVVALIIWLVHTVRRPGSSSGPSGPRRGNMDILKERYAKGEITKEEFQSMKKDLVD
jgi:putative membrane protein